MRFSLIAALAQASFALVAGAPLSARPVADLAVATAVATPVATATLLTVAAPTLPLVAGGPRLAGRQGGMWRDRLDAVMAHAGEAGFRLLEWGAFGRQRGAAVVQAANEIDAGVSRRGALERRQGGRWRGRLGEVLGRVRDWGLGLMEGGASGRRWGEKGRQKGEAAVQAANEVVAGVSRRGALEGRQGRKWRERLDSRLARAWETGLRLKNWGDFGRQRGDAAVQATNETVAGVSRPCRAVPVLAARDWRQDLSAAKSLASSVVSSARDTASTTAAASAESSSSTATTTIAPTRDKGECRDSNQQQTSTITVSLVFLPSLTTVRQPAAQTVLPPSAAQASAANSRARVPSAAAVVLASVGTVLCAFGRFFAAGMPRGLGHRGGLMGSGEYGWGGSPLQV
ncbi:hypothetical protein C8A05DRAFT_29180 [Staphylotrichum tortipilum]|uniref:Uncharacterized protein n=1 Tax=Staphylotrichum tortipilum TaxID=2831512 RepID=A0AAN6RXC7_9PEZI|nr:hypothetical protein C8A05DRAFT_29180 [Staphylotrichum longicolle]